MTKADLLERLFQLKRTIPNDDGTMFMGAKFTGHQPSLADLTDQGLDSWIAAIHRLFETDPISETHHAQTQPNLLAALERERARR